MRKGGSALDWKEILFRAKRAEGEWVMVAGAQPATILRTIKVRRNQALRDEKDGVLEGKMPIVSDEGIGDLFVRFEWRTPPPKRMDRGNSKRQLRILMMPPELRRRLKKRAHTRNVPVSDFAERALRRYVNRGHNISDPTLMEQQGVHVSIEIWDAALERARIEGVVLADVLRDEIEYDLARNYRKGEGID